MVRGCRFLIDRAARDATVMPGCERTARVALRLAGNCLKELDRFLAILIDEHARLQRRRRATAPQRRVTPIARKLSRIKAMESRFPVDVLRLRAIGRVRAFATGHSPVSPGTRLAHDLAIAARGQGLVPTGTELHPSSVTRHWLPSRNSICR
jgi:hypothetical protein